MNDNDRTQTVDRRGHAAGRALDAALADVTPPPLPVPAGRNNARWAPLLVAAALVVIALVAAAFVSLPSDEGTVADEGDRVETLSGSTRMVVDDPGAAGLTVRAAGHGSRGYGNDFGEAAVHVPDNDWDRAVVVTTSEYHPFVFSGVVVDVGGPDAVIGAHEPGGVLWRDGNLMHSISSAHLADGTLVDLAADTVAAGWNGNGPLPGHDVAYTGSTVDLQPAFALELLPQGSGAVAYTHEDAPDFVVSWQPGSEARWRAELVNGSNRRDVKVGDTDAVATDHWAGPVLHVASWVEPDGTIVRVGTYGDLDHVLRVVGDSLTAVDQATFARLVSANPPEEGQGMFRHDDLFPITDVMNADDPWGTAAGNRVLADVSAKHGNTTFRTATVEQPDGLVLMHLFTIGSSRSGGGSSGAVRLDWPVLRATDVTTTGDPEPVRMVGGVVPDGWSVVRVLNRDTGTVFPLVDERSEPALGSDSMVVVAVAEVDGFDEVPLEVVLRSDDGTEQRYWL